LRDFLGINLIMTYIRYPQIQLYWSSDDSLRMNLIADNMPVNHFEEIARFLHFVDAENAQDKFNKVRPVLDKLSETFVAATDFEEHLSVDEMIIPFKGRSSLKQYFKSKPKPWGFKVWYWQECLGMFINLKCTLVPDRRNRLSLELVAMWSGVCVNAYVTKVIKFTLTMCLIHITY